MLALRIVNNFFWILVFYFATRGRIQDTFKVLISAIVCILLGFATDRLIRRAGAAKRL